MSKKLHKQLACILRITKATTIKGGDWMNWKEIYQSKLTTAEMAVKNIPDESRIVLSHAMGEPYHLVKAMTDNYRQYRNVEIVHWVNFGECAYTKPEMAGHIRLNALFAGPNSRAAVESGMADFTPAFFGMTPEWFTDGTLVPDVAMLGVSPPDKHGYVSTGVSVCATKPAALAAKIVIAQVNDQMPRTLGDSFLHVSQLTHIVEHSEPLKELHSAEIGELEKKIGENCAGLVEDGATLQLGIGSLPDAVLANLGDKKDLGIHSEMFSDGVVNLVEKGVITGARKTINNGKITVGFLMGTRKLYDFVDDNPMVQMLPINYVNDPCVIMQNYKMTSINSCLQVDFTGQVNSESIGIRQYSGMGGQLDYVRGASMCKDGKAILAMPSTAAKGTLSRIVPILDPGATVTTTRTDVQYIVTEYGIANLRGRTLAQRAKALIDIAHPDFRAELTDIYEKRFGRRGDF